MNKEERIIKNILSITPADTTNLPSYEYLQKLSINQATEILMLQQRIDKSIEFCEKQKRKMYKSRNKIAMFILIKLLEILKGESNDQD